ncbi:MAG TPA: pyridoxamine 5'-phosphate oxidase family protein [Deltaproteobacteria bacterium]|nr:pyridoxamine 5'-phosphate oxidase family protein [Deltaproteobacteria bacterium]HPR54549.1 pyridoxamine 5'-phosphate oxidase family protein [Deltaproteobacteria bacterium]HXK47371.1 pyridoxamine 5'-phosphate oxidase family protein [Deltaproteobacteria bacterium]
MKLSEYFEHARGKGILATSDPAGPVNAAVYARPHFMDDDTVAFIMAERLSHENLTKNPHAVYLFMEDGEHYTGRRLYLTMIREEENVEVINTLRRSRHYIPHDEYYKENKFLVTFRIDKVLPLVGKG